MAIRIKGESRGVWETLFFETSKINLDIEWQMIKVSVNLHVFNLVYNFHYIA